MAHHNGALPHYEAVHCSVFGGVYRLESLASVIQIQRQGKIMALKPPPLSEMLQQVSDLVGSSDIRSEVDRGARSLAQSALSRLDVVTREEFDVQAEILRKTRGKVVALETQLEELTHQMAALTKES